MALQERLSRIEATQLDNNVILTGIQEQQWKRYEMMHQRVIDIIAEAIKPIEGSNTTTRAGNVLISNCKQIGTYQIYIADQFQSHFNVRKIKTYLCQTSKICWPVSTPMMNTPFMLNKSAISSDPYYN